MICRVQQAVHVHPPVLTRDLARREQTEQKEENETDGERACSVDSKGQPEFSARASKRWRGRSECHRSGSATMCSAIEINARNAGYSSLLQPSGVIVEPVRRSTSPPR